MADEKISQEQVQQFIHDLLTMVENEQGKGRQLLAQATDVARGLSLHQDLRALTFSGLASLLLQPKENANRKAIELFIQLTVDIAYSPKEQAYRSRWYTDFRGLLISKLLDAKLELIELQSPNGDVLAGVQVSPETKGRFGEMLVSSMNVLEDTGKCGNLTLKKTSSYTILKQWGEAWMRGGFTTQERELLTLVLPAFSRVAKGLSISLPEQDASSAKSDASLDEKLKALEVRNQQASDENKSLQYKVETLTRKSEQLENEKKVVVQRMQSLEHDIEQLNTTLEETTQRYNTILEREREDARMRREALQKQLEDVNREFSMSQQRANVEKIQLTNALQPLYMQFSAGSNQPMSEDLGCAYRRLVERIFEEMKAKGFDFN